MKRILLVAAFFMLVTGCATSSIPEKKAQFVPPERVFRTEQLVPEGNATALFIRDEGFLGSGVYQHLYIDQKEAALINPGEKVEFILVPGEYIFGVVPTDPFGTKAIRSIDQELKAGRKYFYRIQTDGDTFQTVIQRFRPETE